MLKISFKLDYILKNEFSVISLVLLAIVTWTTRLMENSKKKMKSINLIIIDDLTRLQEAYAPTPSALLNGTLDIHTIVVSTINFSY